MNEIVVDAIVIGTTEVNEKDKMIRCVTHDGYLSFYAKGVSSLKSKNAPSLTTFSKSNFILFESTQGNYLLKTGILRKSYFSLRSFEEVTICSLIEELCKLFVNETISNGFYEFLDKTLDGISNGEDPVSKGLTFMGKLLLHEGCLPPDLNDLASDNEKKIYKLLVNNQEVIGYEKGDNISVICKIMGYIEQTFNITLRTKELVSII